MNTKQSSRTNFFRRAGKELKEYAILSLYLYICFSAIMLYTSAVLRAHNIDYEPYGLAAAKALVLAKFMMIGNVLPLGRAFERRPLIYHILFKSAVFLAVLGVLSVLEELIVGVIRGRLLVEFSIGHCRRHRVADPCYLRRSVANLDTCYHTSAGD